MRIDATALRIGPASDESMRGARAGEPPEVTWHHVREQATPASPRGGTAVYSVDEWTITDGGASCEKLPSPTLDAAVDLVKRRVAAYRESGMRHWDPEGLEEGLESGFAILTSSGTLVWLRVRRYDGGPQVGELPR
jgi:hypothetical protein